jgi:hypothetical protein
MPTTLQELQHFRKISRCEDCAHYSGCPLYVTMLLFHGERRTPFQKYLVNLLEPCAMFLLNPWTKATKKARAAEGPGRVGSPP